MKLFIGFIGRTRGGELVEIVAVDSDGDFFSKNDISYYPNGRIWGEENDDDMDIIEQIHPDRTQKVDVLNDIIEKLEEAIQGYEDEWPVCDLIGKIEGIIEEYKGNDND